MYKGNPFLQYQRRPTDAINPSSAKLGLADRFSLARGQKAVAAMASHLAQSKLTTPWTVAPRNVRKAASFATRSAASTLSRGASEVSRGISKVASKLKFW